MGCRIHVSDLRLKRVFQTAFTVRQGGFRPTVFSTQPQMSSEMVGQDPPYGGFGMWKRRKAV
ncbi:hypothetical protein HMPREF9123_2010 [Neisseria bacilliformis ATCC BAA-1200]|uniref:Uncharacterized protein n=1 Tax=Neisseria bacilliformis ATCC BAA-1200 TaxID=888742 RepID=F2BE54_9NEIS|nr:hypothetical protein HMPREF9123_2010 [Neisseria bacilliformis ATCC BAA-1200]